MGAPGTTNYDDFVDMLAALLQHEYKPTDIIMNPMSARDLGLYTVDVWNEDTYYEVGHHVEVNHKTYKAIADSYGLHPHQWPQVWEDIQTYDGSILAQQDITAGPNGITTTSRYVFPDGREKTITTTPDGKNSVVRKDANPRRRIQQYKEQKLWNNILDKGKRNGSKKSW